MIYSKKITVGLLLALLFVVLPALSFCQPGATVQFDKPAKYEKRVLPSEKPADKPINPVRKAAQNLGSHYNFHFNASQKLNEILFNAKTSFKDDFNKLLPFYNYTLDVTASQLNDLDSVIAKCNDAILLHDLRNDWVDDLYLLMGQAYFYRKQPDSALITFQYVNYAFQPRTKEEIGYNKAIGSNANGSGNVYTISTAEKKYPLQQIVGHTPARNDALLWIIRTLTEIKQTEEAWGLIETLKRDSQFPKRLQHDLQELQAHLFYQQQQYDSAAHYLEASLPRLQSTSEKARAEFLLAQLYERSKKWNEADRWYERSIGHTTNLVMEAYARINRIRLIQDNANSKQINEQISELMSMAKKEKYADYLNFIYYAAAQMEKARNVLPAAVHYLHESAQKSNNDPSFKNSVLLELGELAWDQGNYRLAALGYDSISVNDPGFTGNAVLVSERKNILATILTHMETIRVEDSLLRIAAMPENDRNTLLRNILKQLRKAQGLKEDAAASSSFMGGTSSVVDPSRQDQPVDLFSGNNAGGRGEWYFYNASMKSRGQREFKAVWGERPNADNWRRVKAITVSPAANIQSANATDPAASVTTAKVNPKNNPVALTIDALYANLPMDQQQVKVSNDSIESAMYQLGKLFRERLEDCSSLIRNNEELINRFPQTRYMEEAVFGLYYCHQRTGNLAKAESYKNFLKSNHTQSRFLRMINDPKGVEKENNQFAMAATATYEQVYLSFIEGNFNKAILDKRKADSSYGENYWTPQLLYIEAVYHIQQREDSLATAILDKLRMLFPTSPMAAKAATLSSVLSRRSELEKYLTELQVERMQEDSFLVSEDRAKNNARPMQRELASSLPGKLTVRDPGLQAPELPKKKETVSAPAVKAGEVKPTTAQPLITKADTSSFKRPVAVKKEDGYSFIPTDEHLVILALQKVDIVYLNEARNALNRYNRDKFRDIPLELSSSQYSDDTRFITVSKFSGAVDANDYLKRAQAGASSEIFPWLPKEKYFFMIISPANLELLQNRKDLSRYLELFKENFPLK